MPNKLTSLLLCLVMVLGETACSPIENNARDAAAGLNGALTAAITKYQPVCNATPNAQVCNTIRSAIAGQNALVTAIETYCGWSTAAPPPDPIITKCVPLSSAKQGLVAAIANANQFTLEIKGAI